MRSLAPPAVALAMLVLSAAAHAGITPSLTASRTSGAAPLAVQFSAVDTRHSNKGIDTFRQLFYEWDFGETAAGRNPGHWRFGISQTLSRPLSKDTDCCSPIAAHVYDQPGTYTARVTIRDRAGNTATQAVTITVQNPDQIWSGTSTVCVSPDTNFSGCPTGARRVTTGDFDIALQQHCKVNGNTPSRCLFRRSAKFVADRETRTGHGPHYIGAFGSGADPIVDQTANSDSSLITPAGDDIRIRHLDVRRANPADSTTFVRAQTSTTATHVLIYQNKARGTNQIFSSGTLNCDVGVNGHWFMVENEAGPTLYANSGNGIMWAGRRQTFMGNYVYEAQASPGGADGHEVRIQCLQHGYFAHNTIRPGPTPGVPLTIRTPRNDRDGGHCSVGDRDCVITNGHCTERNVVSGNYIDMDLYSQQERDTVAAGTSGGFAISSASFDGCIQDNIIERHYVKFDQFGEPGTNRGSKRGPKYEGRRGTIRNVVVNCTQGIRCVGVDFSANASDSPSMNYRGNEVYDLTIYAGTKMNAEGVQGVASTCKDGRISEVALHNILVYSKEDFTVADAVTGSGPGCRVVSKAAVCSNDRNDSTRSCTITDNPFPGTPDPQVLDSHFLRSGASMVDVGSPLGSLYGILGNRVVDGAPDVGAAELISPNVAVPPIPPILLEGGS
jgi:PKD repeat protein